MAVRLGLGKSLEMKALASFKLEMKELASLNERLMCQVRHHKCYMTDVGYTKHSVTSLVKNMQ